MRGGAPRGEDPDVTLRLPRTVLDAVMSRATTFADAIAQGDAAVEGAVRTLLTFGTLTDRPDARLPIVTR
ncbi:alkyl sulfatase C-terminal domain-containing protein [Streptomyces atroolivaceus]|uniref:alkyl sulfatase C-terminal domain-containing protein n=1 Tax=Streptomyces atroolivaceus TaxID=66869 RepID=UPI003F4CFA73